MFLAGLYIVFQEQRISLKLFLLGLNIILFFDNCSLIIDNYHYTNLLCDLKGQMLPTDKVSLISGRIRCVIWELNTMKREHGFSSALEAFIQIVLIHSGNLSSVYLFFVFEDVHSAADSWRTDMGS